MAEVQLLKKYVRVHVRFRVVKDQPAISIESVHCLIANIAEFCEQIFNLLVVSGVGGEIDIGILPPKRLLQVTEFGTMIMKGQGPEQPQYNSSLLSHVDDPQGFVPVLFVRDVSVHCL